MSKKRRGELYDEVKGMWKFLRYMYPEDVDKSSMSKILAIISIMRER